MNNREHSARQFKARELAKVLRRAGLMGPQGAAIARDMSPEQWRLAASAASVNHPSDKTKELVYAAIVEAAEPVTITTTLNHLTYTVTVTRGGKQLSQESCPYTEVVNLRNRLCAYWSNHASDVSANGIPSISTMREKAKAS